jgi:hypothetical protein
MKHRVALVLITLVAVAPSSLSAQDTASTKRLSAVDRVTLNWFNGPNTLRLYAPTRPALNSPKTDMGVQPACPMPRVIPDTTHVTAMPRVKVDTTVDPKMRFEVSCGRK